jgi:hypothetical protein
MAKPRPPITAVFVRPPSAEARVRAYVALIRLYDRLVAAGEIVPQREAA